MSFSCLKFKPVAATLLAMALAGCMSQPMSSRVAMESSADNAMASKSVAQVERLGTQWGDEVQSSVQRVDLRRVGSQPLAEHVLH